MLSLLVILLPLIIIVSCLNINKKITGETNTNGTRNVEIMVPLKHLSNFWRTLNCKTNLIVTWSKECIIASNTTANQETTFAITDTKTYVPVVNLSTQDHPELLLQLKLSFKKIINWNKYQSKVSTSTKPIFRLLN